MRKRNYTVTIRMNKEEYDLFQSKVKESGRTQQEVVIKAIADLKIASTEEVEELKRLNQMFADILSQLRGATTNINHSIIDIFNNASNIVVKVQGWINKLFKNYPDIETMATEKLKAFSTDLGTVIEKIQPMFENILSGAWGVINVLKNFVFGFIVSIYMLCSKEKLLARSPWSLSPVG